MITFGLGQIVSSHLMQKLSSNACYRAVEVKMVLSLTRSLASTQLRRTFTHQTWVSGWTTFFFQLSILVFHCKDFQYRNQFSSGPPRTRIAFAEKVAHGLLISAGVLAGGIFLHRCWTLVWKILTQDRCGSLLTSRTTNPGIENQQWYLTSPY